MSKATWVQTNFNGGEWSPLAYGRFDIAKYKNGLKTCLNFLPTQQGGLTRRPGSRFVLAAKSNAYRPRLQRFEFSTTQAYMLEFGDYCVRIFANHGAVLYPTYPAWAAGTWAAGSRLTVGGLAYVSVTTHSSTDFAVDLAAGRFKLLGDGLHLEVETPYSKDEIWNLGFVQSADTLYIVHADHPPAKLQRAAADTWTLTDVAFLDGPYLSVNTSDTLLTPSGTSGAVTVTASSIAGINGGVGFRAEDIGRMLRMKCSGSWIWGTVITYTSPTQVIVNLADVGGSAAPYTATAVATLATGTVSKITILDGGSGYYAQPPEVAIAPASTTPAVISIASVDGFGAITGLSIDNPGSGYANDPKLILVTGTGSGGLVYARVSAGQVVETYILEAGTGYNLADTINVVGGGSAGSGATASAVVTDGVVTSIQVTSAGSGYAVPPDVTIAAPVALAASSTTFWRLGLWNSTDGYPTTATFHQARLCFAGALNSPGRVDASNTGDYENFAPTQQDGTVVDSSAFSFSLDSGTVNVVRWLVSDENGLLAGTAGGEWVVAPSSTQQAITPTNINAKPLGNFGSAPVAPLRVGKATLFVQRTKRKLREVFYQFTYNTFQATDISLVSEHLTKGGLKQLAIQFAPQQIVWITREDGSKAGMTYDKDQEVLGWHRHALGGYSDAAQTLPPVIDSMDVIPSPDGTRDEVWVAVQRYIDGAVFRSIEYFTKSWEDGDSVVDAVFADSSAEYSGTPTTTVSGLTWLAGQTVGVLADGAAHPDCTVSVGGAITLSRSASKVQVGLRYVSQAETLPIEAGGDDGPSQGKRKRVFRAIFRFFQSIGLELWSAAPGVGFYPLAFRDSNDAMTTPVPLFDGVKRWPYDESWTEDGRVLFQTSNMLPCNITLLSAQLESQDAQ